MSNKKNAPSLDAAFEQAEFEAKTAHYPSTINAAVPVYRAILERLHAAVLAGDDPGATRAEQDAEDLVVKLNGGTHFGMIGDDEAPGRALPRLTASPEGDVPLWGQQGAFTIRYLNRQIRVELDGMFAIGVILAFEIHAVDKFQTFPSDTGYRSFMGFHDARAAFTGTVDAWVRKQIAAYVQNECKGKLQVIKPMKHYRHAELNEPYCSLCEMDWGLCTHTATLATEERIAKKEWERRKAEGKTPYYVEPENTEPLDDEDPEPELDDLDDQQEPETDDGQTQQLVNSFEAKMDGEPDRELCERCGTRFNSYQMAHHLKWHEDELKRLRAKPALEPKGQMALF